MPTNTAAAFVEPPAKPAATGILFFTVMSTPPKLLKAVGKLLAISTAARCAKLLSSVGTSG